MPALRTTSCRCRHRRSRRRGRLVARRANPRLGQRKVVVAAVAADHHRRHRRHRCIHGQRLGRGVRAVQDQVRARLLATRRHGVRNRWPPPPPRPAGIEGDRSRRRAPVCVCAGVWLAVGRISGDVNWGRASTEGCFSGWKISLPPFLKANLLMVPDASCYCHYWIEIDMRPRHSTLLLCEQSC